MEFIFKRIAHLLVLIGCFIITYFIFERAFSWVEPQQIFLQILVLPIWPISALLLKKFIVVYIRKED